MATFIRITTSRQGAVMVNLDQVVGLTALPEEPTSRSTVHLITTAVITEDDRLGSYDYSVVGVEAIQALRAELERVGVLAKSATGVGIYFLDDDE